MNMARQQLTAVVVAAFLLATLAVKAQGDSSANACTWPASWDVATSSESGLRMPGGGKACGDLGDFPLEECCCWCHVSANWKWCRFGQVEDESGEMRGAKWADLCKDKVVVPGSAKASGSDSEPDSIREKEPYNEL